MKITLFQSYKGDYNHQGGARLYFATQQDKEVYELKNGKLLIDGYVCEDKEDYLRQFNRKNYAREPYPTINSLSETEVREWVSVENQKILAEVELEKKKAITERFLGKIIDFRRSLLEDFYEGDLFLREGDRKKIEEIKEFLVNSSELFIFDN